MGDFKQYTIDANFFRYHADNNSDKLLRKAAVAFWKTAKVEIEQGEAAILVPAEVVRELEVQSQTLSGKEYDRILRLLDICQEVSPLFSIALEHHIRIMSAYLRAKYRHAFNNLSVSYGGVSDARILYSAYAEDSILVTANVKDFMLYPFLFSPDENRLYDLKKNQFIHISSEAYAEVWQDPHFQKLFNQLRELEVELEEG